MTVEEQLKKIILERYKSVRAFTQVADLPYSTVDTMFKRGISGTGVSTVLKIFNILDLDVESISNGILVPNDTKKAPTDQVSESDFQKQRLLHNYDSLNQTGKDKLIEYSDDLKVNPKYNIPDEEKTVRIRAIARNGTITESEVTQKDIDEALAMIKASETDCDL